MTYSFEITCDLYQAGRSCDGQPYHAECYYVIAMDEDGNTWGHNHVFPGCAVSLDEEGEQHFQDIRQEAKAKVAALLARVEKAGAINLAYWSEMSPVYGSKAYQAYGQAQDYWAEKNGQPYRR